MASTTEIAISEQVRFLGALMGTTGITEVNNTVCNNYINRLLSALDPFIGDLEDEAQEMIEQRRQDKKRIEEEPTHIIAPTGHDLNHLNIK